MSRSFPTSAIDATTAGCLSLTLLIGLSACCCDPEDPSDPAATQQAKFVEGWLDDLAKRRDEVALQKLRFNGPPPPDWDAGRFGQRVDRLRVFRSVEAIEWTEARYRLNKVNPNSHDPFGERVLTCLSNTNPSMRLKATVRARGAAHRLEVSVYEEDGLRLGNVDLDGKSLVPSDEPTISTAPVERRPAGDLLLRAAIDRYFIGPTPMIRVKSPVALSPATSVRLRADCRYGDRWFRHTIVTNLAEPLNLSAPMASGEAELCQVRVRVSEEGTVESRSWCWTPTKTELGPCRERRTPRRRAETPVHVEDVARRVTDDGLLRIDYALHANEPLPSPGQPERYHLAVHLRCGEQKVRTATRPLDREQQPFGLFLSAAALFDEPAASFQIPCELEIELARETPYEQGRWRLFEGCLTETEVVPKPCR